MLIERIKPRGQIEQIQHFLPSEIKHKQKKRKARTNEVKHCGFSTLCVGSKFSSQCSEIVFQIHFPSPFVSSPRFSAIFDSLSNPLQVVSAFTSDVSSSFNLYVY